MRKEYDFAHMKKAEPRYLRRMKAAVTMRLDASVITYFRSLANDIGMPYQSLINLNKSIEDWANNKNPLFGGENSNLLSMIPFLVLMVLLYLVGREVILKNKPETSSER